MDQLLVKPWDQLKYAHEESSPQCLHRVKKDIAHLYAKPLAGLYISPEKEDITKVHALVQGPAGTPYFGGLFHFVIQFPHDYPMSPPRIRFMTAEGGRMHSHRNLSAWGRASLSILENCAGPVWNSTLCLENVLVWLQSLFFDPYFHKGYNNLILQETVMTAVCDTVETALRESPEYPKVIREQILKSFSESYLEYVNIISNNLHLRGRVLQCEPLLARLKELKEMVKG